MRTLRLLLSEIQFASLLFASLCLTPAANGQTVPAGRTFRINLDAGTTYQVIDGFGASDAWRCDFVGKNWPLEKRERVADLLFSQETDAQGNPKGIGLSIWRFNIGAGTAEQGAESGIGDPWRRAECPLNSDGTYDWSKQAGQQWFLRAAKRRGVERLLAFINSPPVHLTRNGKGYAPKGPPYLNIRPGKLGACAAFLTDVVEHFEKEGLHFDYLSPVNEPQWGWDGGQEGSPAENTDIYLLVRYLSSELSRRKLTTRLEIGEAATFGYVMGKAGNDGRDEQARFFFDPSSPFFIGNLPNVAPVISAHDYWTVWPPDSQVKMRNELHRALHSANPKLGYWQSEYCILGDDPETGGGGKRDLGMNTALFVARIIHNDLTLAHASSWQWWTAVANSDYKDGLVYLDDGSQGETGKMGTDSLMRDGAVRDSKLLWALGNWSRFVRPGMVRIKCEIAQAAPAAGPVGADGLLASAYKGKGGELVVVIVNLSKEEVRCRLGGDRAVDVYTTSSTASLEKSRQSAAAIKLPARALCTCILK
jgi:O-glycosyl hydrolase